MVDLNFCPYCPYSPYSPYRPFLKCFLLFFLLLPLLSAASEKGYTVIEDRATLRILTPELSERRNLKIKLDNGLEALLISDSHTDHSGAMLSVKTGSWDNPDAFPGLAHYVEHMLFMGTKHYPDVADFSNFIAEHGGETNAFTANDFTSFMFSCDNAAFSVALQRFAYFFKEPLFSASAFRRELHAVDQEFAKNSLEDDFRLEEVLQQLANPAHPYSRFIAGNLHSLKNLKREQMIEWYQAHYSADLMRLVIISDLDLEQLTQLTVTHFQGIPTHQHPKADKEKPIFRTQDVGKMIYIPPLQASNKLVMLWEMPATFARDKDSKPEAIVCQLLGAEDSKSLLSALRQAGWAEALECNFEHIGGLNYILSLDIQLSNRGVQEVNDVISMIFAAISLFRQQGNDIKLFTEIKQLASMGYRYQARKDVFSELELHAALINEESLETYPEKAFIADEFNSSAVQAVFDRLTPSNSLIAVIASSSLTGIQGGVDVETPYMQVPYAVRMIPADLMARWSEAKNDVGIATPSANVFIPSDFTLVQERSKTSRPILPQPTKVIDRASGVLYYCADDRYFLPSVSLMWQIKTPEVDSGNPVKCVLAELYVEAFKDVLRNTSYVASLAGLDNEIVADDFGIKFSLHGYKDKAPILFKQMMINAFKMQISVEQFELFRSQLLRKYQAMASSRPLEQAEEFFQLAIYQHYSSAASKAQALKEIDLHTFQEFTDRLFTTAFIEGMFFGNLSQQEALELGELLFQSVEGNPYLVAQQSKKKIIDLSGEGPFYLEKEIAVSGNALILAIAQEGFSLEERAVQQILMEAINQPFFTALRTMQQTGYLVDSQALEIEKHLFCIFSTQSNTHDPRDLLARFELFIEEFLQKLVTDTHVQDQFDNIKKSLIAKLTFSAKNIAEMGKLLYRIAFVYHADFQWLDKRIASCKQLTFAAFLKQAQELLGRHNKKRLALLLEGTLAPENRFIYKPFHSLQELHKLSRFSTGEN